MRVRPGGLLDIHGISEAYAESWKSTYQGIAPEMFVKGMTIEAAKQIFHESLRPNQYSYFLHVAETDEGKIVGFVDGGKERSHPEKVQSGMNSMVVWVLEKSPNRRFYESTGGQLQTGVKTLNIVGNQIVLVHYLWKKLQ